MAGKVNPNAPRKLTDFKLLSFDVYSTLIDEKGGLFTHLHPLLSRLADPQKFQYLNNAPSPSKIPSPRTPIAKREAPSFLPRNPTSRLSLLRPRDIRPPWQPDDNPQSRSRSPAPFPRVFPHEISILGTIKNNMDIGWDAIYTAQTIGSYKPDLRNFEYLVKHAEDDLGVQKEEILHTAQSLRADHVPVKKMNMNGVWIDRDDEGQDYEKLKGRSSACMEV
ncbi:hypothetical protein DID88_003452 [Monilinia fructigena]|uniref:Haloacid dehalogenase n=1 Tax=Monilinia fructigena TaxID=38457 RepID=A0A395IZN4_9HELO|nr:hypothetical protein DID88_003452 [Monilinia fructigena]